MDVLQQQRSEPQSGRAARMAPLAKLPVFWALERKRAVIVGGSDAAAWKAELLAACGAEVHVYAPTLSDTFARLIALGAVNPEGCYTHHPHSWTPAIFTGASIAIADCEEDDEAKDVFDAARAAGVPVNVIDKPAFCQFQFGSIVNRSPVVVSISTNGAAPILAQAIRRRIETLLPHSLKAWAELAQSLRGKISECLSPGPQRRAFWERFVDRAFGPAPDHQNSSAIFADIAHSAVSPHETGRVTLVGAGPGDAELLTLKAMRALQAADVILFDDLVSDDVLELARREAKRMLVGKRGGRESCRQEDINEMMIKFAKAGKHVVRLKSGDPMIFGRAGEEIACLEQQGIPVDVVPGITAASAMASRLGISLTHRDHAQSVRFITGHSRKGILPENFNWQTLADPHTTTIYYMAGRTAGEIAANLVAAGMSADTPAVFASAITRVDERTWIGSLRDLPEAVRQNGLDQPILLGIGPVFASRQTLFGTERHHSPRETSSPIPLARHG